ncbi:MAG: SoxR reducing system RseC family protein [Alistipes sp.]|nr:SoxR reducing system RseC family protein [Alistipes sp.]
MAQIKHNGEVVGICGDTVKVRLTVSSACSGCHAKAVCGVDESAEKIVEISGVEAAEYSVGEVVEVALQSNSMGAMAVVLTYVVPFFVLALLLVGSTVVGLSEGAAALVALGGVVVYYLVLYLVRERVKKTIKFIIIKQTK